MLDQEDLGISRGGGINLNGTDNIQESSMNLIGGLLGGQGHLNLRLEVLFEALQVLVDVSRSTEVWITWFNIYGFYW